MDLNIRDFPEELNKALKLEAVTRGVSLRELVIEKCSAIVLKQVAYSDLYPERFMKDIKGKKTKPGMGEIGTLAGISVEEQSMPTTTGCQHGRMGICLECKGL